MFNFIGMYCRLKTHTFFCLKMAKKIFVDAIGILFFLLEAPPLLPTDIDTSLQGVHCAILSV